MDTPNLIQAVGDGWAAVQVLVPVKQATRLLSGDLILLPAVRPVGCECRSVCGCQQYDQAGQAVG